MSKEHTLKKDLACSAVLAAIFFFIESVAIHIDVHVQQRLVEAYLLDTIHPTDLYFLENLYNHVGDAYDLFILSLVGFFFLQPWIVAAPQHATTEDEQSMITTRNILISLLLVALSAILIDAESVQLLIKSGTPDLKDILAGFFGIVAGFAVLNPIRHLVHLMYPKRNSAKN